MNVLVLGGAGYIGSHTIVELLNDNHTVICVDNLVNSSKEAINRIEKITNKTVKFYDIDLCDIDKLKTVFDENKIDSAIMFAGLKAVGESVEKPLLYYHNNLLSLMNLLKLMKDYKVNNIVFSSSATVYGYEKGNGLKETDKANDLNTITNPYGKTKAIIENILMDESKSNKDLKVCLLRYFNPVGAHESGLLGEDPKGIPNNLMPYIAQVAVGKREKLHVWGNDYDTKDGTGVRDYIHVVDLAKGHILALNKLANETKENLLIYNLGNGVGYSVLDVVNEYEKASGKKIAYVIDKRRAGDIDTLYCDPTKAREELGFNPKLTLYDMCKSSYEFQINNPNGYN